MTSSSSPTAKLCNWVCSTAYEDIPAEVPKEAAATMEGALKRVYDSSAYKEYSHRNMLDNNYLDSAGFAKYLAVNRLVQEEFLRALGVVK